MMNDNNKLNVILAGISIFFVIISIYMVTIINNQEQARIYFHMEEIENINWIDEKDNISFKITDNKLYFNIGDDVIVDNKEIDLDTQTGNIKYDGVSDKIYLRSANSGNIVVWYNKREYRLTKEIINR